MFKTIGMFKKKYWNMKNFQYFNDILYKFKT